MRPQRITPRMPRACVVCGIDTTWLETTSGHRARNMTCSPACRSELERQRVAVREQRRLWSAIEVTADCWWWLGSLDPCGYGYLFFGGRLQGAHRVVYQVIVGAIPDGLTLDHTCHTADVTCEGGCNCRHRRCVNPAHLEPVERAENFRRGYERWLAGHLERCKHGHEMTPENTYLSPVKGKRRVCRTCTRLAQRKRQARLKVRD